MSAAPERLSCYRSAVHRRRRPALHANVQGPCHWNSTSRRVAHLHQARDITQRIVRVVMPFRHRLVRLLPTGAWLAAARAPKTNSSVASALFERRLARNGRLKPCASVRIRQEGRGRLRTGFKHSCIRIVRPTNRSWGVPPGTRAARRRMPDCARRTVELPLLPARPAFPTA